MELLEIPNISIRPGQLQDIEDPESTDFEYKTINIVCLGILKLTNTERINFESVEKRIKVKRLNRFPCVLFKLQINPNNSISCIVFRNGKLIITGLKSETDIPIVKDMIIAQLIEGGIEFSQLDINIQNFVVMTNLHRIVNLELACLTLNNCLYEPEQFPAAIVKMNKSTCLIFSNSKIINLGNKTKNDVEDSLRSLIQELFNNDLFFHLTEDSEFNFDSEEEFEGELL